MLKQELIKGVTLFDMHVPDEDVPSVRAVEMFMKDFKPDYLIWGGDLGNWESFSTWKEGYAKTYQTKDEFDAVNETIRRQQTLCGYKCKYIWLQGNHDEWVTKYCDQLTFAQHKKEYNLRKRLKFSERKIKFIPINRVFKIGKLRFIHGIYHNEHHAKKTLLAYNNNVVYGHIHTEQSFTYISPVDETQVRTGRSRPCLCNLNPHYLKNKPSAWTHGFSVWYVRKNGTFNEYCVNITKGIFTFYKTYNGNAS